MSSKLNRHIRIFISSTFRDMFKEREELIRNIFPRIRRFANERYVEVTEVDLRWGITKEQAEHGETLRICLEEIYKCMESPIFFVGMLGGRYGWIPDNLNEKIKASLYDDLRFQDLLKKFPVDTVSVTELEILFGILENENHKQITFFYLRDPELSKKFIEEIKNKDPEFADEKIDATEKQEKLRERVRKSNEISSRDYKTIEEFASLIEEDLKAEIERLFPIAELPSSVERERLNHEAFAQSRKKVFIRNSKIFDAIDRFIDSENKYLLLRGESGLGKSAIIANYVDELKKKKPDSFIIEHYIGGGGADSSSYKSIMARIIKEINVQIDPDFYKDADKHSLSAETTEKDKKSIPTDIDKLTDMFIEKIDDISHKQQTYIFIDALNQITEEEGKNLYWLQSKLPQNIKFILSATTEPVISDAFLRKQNREIIDIPAFDEAMKNELITCYLEKYGKKLTNNQLEIILTSHLTDNPLFLRALLDEIRIFGVYERLDVEIETLLTVNTIDDLFEKIMARCEIDYDNKKNFVPLLFKLLYLSRDGLTETELLDIINIGRDENNKITPIERSQILIVLDSHLVVKEGNIKFFHHFLEKAVQDRYLQDENEIKRIREILAGDFEDRLKDFEKGEYENIKKIARELPYQYYELKDNERLFESYSSFGVLEYLLDEKDFKDLTIYFEYLRRVDKNYNNKLVEKALKKYESEHFLFYKLANFLSIQNAIFEAIELEEKALKIREALYNENPSRWAEDYTRSLNNLAVSYKTVDRLPEAIELLEKALRILEALYNENLSRWAEDYTRSFINLAGSYSKVNRLPEAIELEEKALKILEPLYNENPLRWAQDYTISLNNLAGSYKTVNRLPEAIELEEKALKIREALYNENPSRWAEDYTISLYILADSYEKIDRLSDATNLFEKALIISKKFFNEDPENWGEIYKDVTYKLSSIYKNQSRFSDAIPLLEELRGIFSPIYNENPEESVESYLEILEELSDLYEKQGLTKGLKEIKSEISEIKKNSGRA